MFGVNEKRRTNCCRSLTKCDKEGLMVDFVIKDQCFVVDICLIESPMVEIRFYSENEDSIGKFRKFVLTLLTWFVDN